MQTIQIRKCHFVKHFSENEAPVAAISRTKTPARKPRKSSVAKNDVEDGEITMKTPAKTPGRRSTVKKAKSFADVKVIDFIDPK